MADEMSSPRQESHETHKHHERHERHEAVEYALLGLLRDGPAHGYRLAAAFGPSGRLGVIARLKMSQMYAYLHKLERAGWLTAADESATATNRQDASSARDAGRMRRVYTLTPAGAHAFDAWLTTAISATREMRLTFLLKLAFVIHDHAWAQQLVAGQRAATAAWLAQLRAREERIRSEERNARRTDTLPETVPASPASPASTAATMNSPLIDLLTVRQRIRLSEATIAWLDETLELLAAPTHSS